MLLDYGGLNLVDEYLSAEFANYGGLLLKLHLHFTLHFAVLFGMLQQEAVHLLDSLQVAHISQLQLAQL